MNSLLTHFITILFQLNKWTNDSYVPVISLICMWFYTLDILTRFDIDRKQVRKATNLDHQIRV